MKRKFPFLLVISGVMIIFAGFVYDVWFAGIPYPDPTPALAARYAFHSQVASIIRWSGLITWLIGGMMLVIRRVEKKGRTGEG